MVSFSRSSCSRSRISMVFSSSKSFFLEFKEKIIAHWFTRMSIIGFIDGSWRKNNDGSINSGIGGFLMLSPNNLIFIFSGPTHLTTPYETELEALLFLVGQIYKSEHKEAHIIIFSDSSSLVSNVTNLSVLSSPSQSDSIASQLLAYIRVVHIDRIFNSEADRLSKEGACRKNMIAALI